MRYNGLCIVEYRDKEMPRLVSTFLKRHHQVALRLFFFILIIIQKKTIDYFFLQISASLVGYSFYHHYKSCTLSFLFEMF